MNTSGLLTAFESCPRAAYWRRLWMRAKLDATEMLQAGIRAGVLSGRTDFGECAGEECYGFGVEPGLETTHYDVHGEVCHLAAIADVVTTALRKAQDLPWKIPEPVRLSAEGPLWSSGAFLDPSGNHLRRVVLASAWNDDRHYSECRSWFSLGEVCAYGLPMQQAVIVLGQSRDGKRHGPWAKGLRHPLNKKLRFRKKSFVAEGFKSSWQPVWREDFDEITTQEWLQAMLDDGVLQDACFTVKIDVPEKAARQRIVDLAARKLEKLEKIKTLPDLQLTGCDWPVPCIFRAPCHAGREPQKGLFRMVEC
jgi:hypothetical protein